MKLQWLKREKERSTTSERGRMDRLVGSSRRRETKLMDLMLRENGTLIQIDEGTWRMKSMVQIGENSIGVLGNSRNGNWRACEESKYGLKREKEDQRE